MQNTPIYEALADAFVAEGVDTHFTLMGDGNMHWVAAMQRRPGRFNNLILDFLRRHRPNSIVSGITERR